MTKFVYNNTTHAFTNIFFFEINIEYNFKKYYEKKSNFKFKTSIVLNQIKELHRVDDIFREILESTQLTQVR